ncbi:MAG: hypothetical protein HQ500_04995 [Flavobacteriales bacterium]|nr:hypothetical protein [Flavobacteriales bacterium]
MSITPETLPFISDSTESWKARVDKELKGKSFEDHLIWESSEGFEMEAWQNSLPSPLANIPPLQGPWKIIEPIYATDAQTANGLALDALMHGAEGIWYYKGFLGAAAEVACKGIDTKIAPVFIRDGNCIDPYRQLLKLGEKSSASLDATSLLNGKRLRERGAGVVDEVAFLLAQAIETGNSVGFEAPMLFHSGVGNAFLTEIAKLRALRWLWSSVLANEGKTAQSPLILASNLSIAYAQNDEHTNILRATSSAMSSILGGAQMVMTEPWNKSWKENDTFSRRISRNTQTLLKEEGRLDKNLNQADGSYFIEHLTTIIATEAWKKVQGIEAAGGFTAYALKGTLRSDLETSAQEIRNAYLNGDRVILGVNMFLPDEVKKEAKTEQSAYQLLPEVLSLPYEVQTAQS